MQPRRRLRCDHRGRRPSRPELVERAGEAADTAGDGFGVFGASCSTRDLHRHGFGDVELGLYIAQALGGGDEVRPGGDDREFQLRMTVDRVHHRAQQPELGARARDDADAPARTGAFVRFAAGPDRRIAVPSVTDHRTLSRLEPIDIFFHQRNVRGYVVKYPASQHPVELERWEPGTRPFERQVLTS